MQMAALVPDISCCVLIGIKTFSTSPNNLAFKWNKGCHLTMCLHLMEPHWVKSHSHDRYLIVAELADLSGDFRVVERLALLLVRRLLVHGQRRQVREEEGAGVALLPDVQHLVLESQVTRVRISDDAMNKSEKVAFWG